MVEARGGVWATFALYPKEKMEILFVHSPRGRKPTHQETNHSTLSSIQPGIVPAVIAMSVFSLTISRSSRLLPDNGALESADSVCQECTEWA